MGTRQLRSQGLGPVHAHRTEGATGPERQEGLNGVGSGIGVGGENGDGNGVGGGDGDGAGTGTGKGVEANEEAPDKNGPETRAIVEMGMGTRIGTRTRMEMGRAEERRRSARNRTRRVDTIWETGETWVKRGKT